MLTPQPSRRRSTLRAPAVLAALSLTALVGCEKPEDIRAYDAPKAPSAVKEVAATQFTPNDFESLVPKAPLPAGPETPAAPSPAVPPAASAAPKRDGPTWDVPKGWTELPASGMRYASFRVSAENPNVQLTVIPLNVQPVLENVNRWEGQIGAPHTPADKIKDVVKKVELQGGISADVVDLSGPGTTGSGPKQRILGAMIVQGTQMWFIKLQGDDTVVGPQKENFDAFVKSIKFGGDKKAQIDRPAAETAASTTTTGSSITVNGGQAVPAAADAEPEKITKYKAPAGWEEDKTPRPLRLLTFRIKEGDKAGEVSVLRLGKDNIGSLLDNVNRWRAQVGAGPVTAVNEGDIPKVTVAGKEALLIDVGGPDEKAPAKRMLLAMAPRGNDVYFYKLLGDATLIEAQKEAFSQFLKSVEFGK